MPVHEKRLIGKGIWYRHEIEGKRLWQCWEELKPASKGNRKSKKRMASRWLRWYKVRFPLQISAALEAAGSTI